MKRAAALSIATLLALGCAPEAEPQGPTTPPHHVYFDEGLTPSEKGAWLASAQAWNWRLETEVFVVHIDAPMGDACGVLVYRDSTVERDTAWVDFGACVTTVGSRVAVAASQVTSPALGVVLGQHPAAEPPTSSWITDEVVAEVRARWGLASDSE